MFVTNPVEAKDAIFGYDVIGNHAVDLTWTREDLGRSIIRAYSLPPSSDPLLWAETQDAQNRFHERGGR